MALKAITTFIVLLAALNLWGWQIGAIGMALGLVYLVLTSYLLGASFGRTEAGSAERLAWGAVALGAALSILGAVSIYIWRLTPEVILALAAALPWLGKNSPSATKAKEQNITWVTALGLTYLALAALTISLIADAKTIEAIRTPWQVVPGYVFVSYALMAATFVLLARFVKSPIWLVPLFLTSLSVLPLVYPLGYGFDPFIHQASEKLISATGTISPKPLYYLGQYALVVGLGQLTRLPLTVIDIWLLPALASLVMPLSFGALLYQLKTSRPWLLILPLIALFGFTAGFTYTTPQGLANLFALAATLLMAARVVGTQMPQKTVWLFVLAALAAHPLTGLPLSGLALLWWMTFEHVTVFGARQKLARVITALATAAAVPLAFVVLSSITPGAASVNFNHDIIGALAGLGAAMRGALPAIPWFVDAGDAVEILARPLTLGLILLAAVGWFGARGERMPLRFFALAAALPALSYIILSLFFTFPGLPANEQNFYTTRLWALALTFACPLMLAGAEAIGTRTLAKLPNFTALAITAALLTSASLYLTYPRLDRWHRDTAYNTTPADIAAVQLIEQNAGGAPYVVLANQAVSAAAISELGFAHYYEGHFYYPVPTGTNPLYGVYLEASERSAPTRQVISAATTHLGIPRVYLVLNRYWADFLKLAPVAGREANEYWQVSGDRLQVYRYDF